jgi:hypothetical protein
MTQGWTSMRGAARETNGAPAPRTVIRMEVYTSPKARPERKSPRCSRHHLPSIDGRMRIQVPVPRGRPSGSRPITGQVDR